MIKGNFVEKTKVPVPIPNGFQNSDLVLIQFLLTRIETYDCNPLNQVPTHTNLDLTLPWG